MSNWIAITTATLYEAKIAVVIDLCDTLLKATGQADRSAGIIQGVVDEVRNSVAKRNRVDSDTTKIPKGLRDLTVDIVIAKLKNALDDELTKQETENVAYRRQQLRDIEKGDGPAIDLPDTAINPVIESPVPAPAFGERTREFTRANQDGI